MPFYLQKFCIFALTDDFLVENEDIYKQTDT